MKNDQGMKFEIISAKDGSKDANRGMITGRALLLFLMVITALFATVQTSEAAGTPTRMIVFTDKDVYRMGSNYDTTTGGTTTYPANSLTSINIKVYLAILDDDGNLIRNKSGLTLTTNLKDVEQYDHTASTTYHSDTISTNGNFWTGSNSTFIDPDGDGIWETSFSLTDADTLGYATGTRRTDQFNISIQVNETVNGLSDRTFVLFTRIACGHSSTTRTFTGTDRHGDRVAHEVACVNCHWGWEHKMGVHGNNTTLGNNVSTLPAITTVSALYNYNVGSENGTPSGNYKNTGRSDICVACHDSDTASDSILDLDGSANVDKNGDGILDNDRPSCSWSQGTNANGVWTSRPGCHDNGPGNTTGTIIEKVPLKNSTNYFLDWKWKLNGPGNSYAHNRTKKNVTCEVCHGNHEVSGLPNQSASKTNINEQCWLCHNITGGLNITSNGGSNIDHSSNDCKSCHQNDTGVLDVHLVPVAGGPDCLSCHDYGKTASMRIKNSAMNSSNASHARLNNNSRNTSDVSAENKKCWGCHSSNGSQPGNTSMGNIYDNPYKCYDCHNATSKPYANASTGMNVTEHFKGGAQIIAASTAADNSSSCVVCHNLSELKVAYIEDDSYSTDYSLSSHYARNRTDLRTWNSSRAANCSYCHQNASTAFTVAMLDPAYNSSIQNHSASSSPVCFNSTCHGSGWVHNSTLTRPALTLPNSTYCQICHPAKQQHNGTQNCTLCHINTSTNDTIHPIKYLQTNGSFITSNTSAVNCSNCHQGAGLANFSSAPMIPDPLNHSSNTSNGTIWGTFWNSSQSSSSCYYCHNNTKHNATALGTINYTKNSYNVKNGSLTTTRWCADCHYNDSINTGFKGSLWNPAPPYISYDNTGKSGWIDHSGYFSSGYNDSACTACHALNGSYTATSLNYSHSLDPGMGGGPNCIACHNLATALSGGAPVGINFTAANASSHNGTNSNNATQRGFVPMVGACWACHDSDGNVTSGHPDRYKNPRTCTECHLGTGTYNASAYNALIVSEHFSNGTDIIAGNSTSNISSCINCHENITEMILYNNDTDYGSFTGDGIRLKGGNMSFYHYGKDRTDIRTGNSANCSYCHRNASTSFAVAMINASYNRSISNHSSNYNSSNPNCTVSQCHSTGWIHNSTLSEPAVNSTFCLTCHGSNGAGGMNYTGAVTGIKERHNNSVNCSECHMNTAKDVHPVKYLRQDATFSIINTSAVTCITCHQTSSVDAALTLSPPKIPAPMHHSDNTSNGTIWNSTAYWTPATPLTSCTYCHNDTVHNASALGRPMKWQGNNVVNSSLPSGTWCASCHYRNYASGSRNYTDMTLAFAPANLSVPPEITNGSYASKIYNRSNYYNHSLTDYSDSVCRLCHGVNLSSAATISNFMHNVSMTNTCIDCHYSFEAMSNTTRPDRYVDAGMYNTSLHRQLSCTDCHTQGHRNMGARKACEDCHAVQANPITDKDRHNITATPGTYFVSGNNVVGITDCTTCHDSTLYNTSISTYGYWKQKDCDYCHTYPDKYYE